jgi:hypothetical protein
MGLELLMGGQGREGAGDRGQEGGDSSRRASGSDLTEPLADAARQIGGVRERLQALIDRTAELGRRLREGAESGAESAAGPGVDDPLRHPPEPVAR